MAEMTLVKYDVSGEMLIDAQKTDGFGDPRTAELLQKGYSPLIPKYEVRPDTAQVENDKPTGIVESKR